uniref:Zinc finger, CCHC-type n=1 Tax=Tanacetum cinerariifolium TaxID=118510 RepID=A0A6L2K132_TANCI|nr:zinc finger, CCHC-type [Tanacetum cinerariifolium]
MDTGKCKTCMLSKITKKPFQNVKHETKVLELIHSNLCDLHATPLLGNKKYFVTFIDDASRVPNKRKRITPYELWTKKKPNLNYLRVWGCRASVRLPDPKLKTLGERGIECIFVRYAEHSMAFRFYVIEPNESVAINFIIELMDAIFDKHRFSSVPRPSQRSLVKGTEDSGGSVTFGLQMDLQRKLKVDGTVEKFKARLVIQDFKKKSRIDYFDTYALVARISTIRLLIAMASFHNLIIHQMVVKTAFLDGKLEDEVYMIQPLGFIMPGNENKVCKLIRSLYGLKQTPKQWHQKFDEVVLSNGYLLNQADKCVYSKFDASDKGVIICLYIDDMLIFGTDQVQVDLAKELLSSKFSMKELREADVINGIRIKHESNGIAISLSHYIEKVLKKFKSTPLDTCEKLMPNRGLAVSQLEYSRVIGCLMYTMTCTRHDIAFAMGKLSRYTSNPRNQHWQAIQKVLKYLKKTIDYRLASKKQTCITGSTIESEFVPLAAAGKEAKWLKNLLLEIPLQMYNGKSRHLGVRHSMIRELITNEVVSIEFVRSQQILADHLTKGLARDLVIKSAEGMGLKYNDNKGKRKHHDTRANPNKKPKVTCWKCGKPGHLKKDCKPGNVGNGANGSSTKGSEDGSSNPLKGQSMFNKSHQIYYITYVSEAFFVQDDDVAWWVDSGTTVNVFKDRYWYKTYESLNDGSILHMGNESTALVHRRGCVDHRSSSGKVVSLLNVLHVPNIRKNLVSSSVLGNCGYTQMIESKKICFI